MTLDRFGSLGLKWTDYIPHAPTVKQLAYLLLPHKEALYGGAAGGGKSDCLLMGALQYVDYPGYSAMILRKTLTDLKQPGALLERSMNWLRGTDAHWEPGTHTWVFPTTDPYGNPDVPAKLTFGYIGESQAYLRYLGIELQYCAFDEVTQHNQEDYRYLFSRLRKLVCPIHKIKDGKPNYVNGCPSCARQRSLPLRMRAATNPGGPGASWVKRRFRIGPDIDTKEAALKGLKVRYIGHHPKRPFIPSFASDNPYLDQESYGHSLDELDPTTREQLRDGRWDVSPHARFKKHWARYYTKRGDYFILGNESHHSDNLIRLFCTVDPAASSKHGPGDYLTWKKEPSYTVISVWGVTKNYHLLWLDMVRFRKEIPDVIAAMKVVNRLWRPDAFYVEANGLGQGVYQGAIREGLTVQPIHTRADKVVNASEAMIRMSQGRIWFPEEASWLRTVEDEVFLWTGDPVRTDDIVDSLSNAARQVAWDDPVVIPENADTGALNNTTEYPSLVYDYDLSGVDSPFGDYYIP